MNNKPKAIIAAWSATPTPLTQELKVDTASVERMVKHHIRLKQQGTAAVVITKAVKGNASKNSGKHRG